MRALDNKQGINKLWPYIHLRIHLRFSVILNTSNKMIFEMLTNGLMVLQIFPSQTMYCKKIHGKKYIEFVLIS